MGQIKIKIESGTLIADFYRAAAETKRIVILLPGLPYSPKSYDLTGKLNGLGFNVLFLHYRGTWGSAGEFLAEPPQEDANLLIRKIRDEGLNDVRYGEVFLMGTSFGGAVSLTVTDDPIIKRVIALSPVISYRKVPTIGTLSEYLISNFPDKYAFRPERFADLIRDEICSPMRHYQMDPSKVLLIGGKEDAEIHIGDIEAFGSQKGIKFLAFDAGHITFSKITDGIFAAIKDFLG